MNPQLELADSSFISTWHAPRSHLAGSWGVNWNCDGDYTMDRESALLHNLISIARIRVAALARDYRADEFIKGIIVLYIEVKTGVFVRAMISRCFCRCVAQASNERFYDLDAYQLCRFKNKIRRNFLNAKKLKYIFKVCFKWRIILRRN